jgi:hypothetical protein
MNDLAPSHLEDPSAGPADLPAERTAYVAAVIRHRCGDVLDEAELAPTQPEMMVPREVAEKITDALELIVARLDAIEDRLGRGQRH